jgi:hypothetical protein
MAARECRLPTDGASIGAEMSLNTCKRAGRRVVSLASALMVGGAAAAAPSAGDCAHEIVGRQTLVEVMETIAGYDTGATTNQSRFVADVLFGLAAHPSLAHAQSFQIDPERFFAAWLEATGRAAEKAPVSMSRVLDYDQHFVVQPDPAIRFEADDIDPPQRALSVRVSWPGGKDAPDGYRYHDRLAEPEVRMWHDRVITYQVAHFGGFVAFENIDGVAGRPTTGALAALFTVLGKAPIRSMRFAVADDGVQVTRSQVKKLFGFHATATVAPDGSAERGVPARRDDLAALERRLAADFEIRAADPPPQPCWSGRAQAP